MGISYDHLLLHIMQGTCNSVLYTKKNIFKKLVFPEKCLNGQILPVQMSPGQMLHGQMLQGQMSKHIILYWAIN